MSGTRHRAIFVTALLVMATLTALSPATSNESAAVAAVDRASLAQAPAAKPRVRPARRCWPINHPSRRPPRLHKHRHCPRPKPIQAPAPAPAPVPSPPPAPAPAPGGTHQIPAPAVSDGWTLVTADEFDAAGLDTSKWVPYVGVPGCCADTRWDPSQVEVSGGTLKLHTSREDGVWRSGGIGGWDWAGGARTYGRFDVRIRFDAGTGVSAAALLWPSDNVWPPEIDFYEIAETWGDRSRMMVTTHWPSASGRQLSQHVSTGDFTQWHTVSVRWSADAIVYLLDDQVVKVETDPARIPDTRMWVGLQTHTHRIDGAWPTLPPGTSSVALEVDWVRVYQAR